MRVQKRFQATEGAGRGRAGLGPALSWVLAAICCFFLLLYLSAQGRAITLMLRGFAPGSVMESTSESGQGTAVDVG